MVEIKDTIKVKVETDLTLWSAIKLRIAGIANYFEKEGKEETKGKEGQELITVKQTMYINRIQFRKVETGDSRCYWLVSLYLSEPNVLLSEIEEKITNTIRSGLGYPNHFDIKFFIVDPKSGFQEWVNSITGDTCALNSKEMIIANKIKQRYEGRGFEYIYVKREKEDD